MTPLPKHDLIVLVEGGYTLPWARHKYGAQALNPEENDSDVSLYFPSTFTKGRSKSHPPAGLQKQTQNMAFVFWLNTFRHRGSGLLGNSHHIDVEFVWVISHEGRLYGAASSI